MGFLSRAAATPSVDPPAEAPPAETAEERAFRIAQEGMAAPYLSAKAQADAAAAARVKRKAEEAKKEEEAKKKEEAEAAAAEDAAAEAPSGLTGTAESFERATGQAKSDEEKREQMRYAVLAAEEAASVAGMRPRTRVEAEAADQPRQMAEALGMPVGEADPRAQLAELRKLRDRIKGYTSSEHLPLPLSSTGGYLSGGSISEVGIARQKAGAPVAQIEADLRRLQDIVGGTTWGEVARAERELLEAMKPKESEYARLQREKDVREKRAEASSLLQSRPQRAVAPPDVMKSEARMEAATTKVFARLDAIRQLREEVEAARIEAESFPRNVTLEPEAPFGSQPYLSPQVRGLVPTTADLEIERRDKQLRALDTLEDNLNKIVRTSLGRPTWGKGAATVRASEGPDGDLAKIRETVKNMTGSAISE